MSDECYSIDGEVYETDPDSCVEGLLDWMDEDEEFPLVRTIEVGEKIEYTFSSLACLDDLFESAVESAYEEVGDHSDGWLDRVSGSARSELSDLLDAWATKHGHQPGFFGVRKTGESVIRILNGDGDWEWQKRRGAEA